MEGADLRVGLAHYEDTLAADHDATGVAKAAHCSSHPHASHAWRTCVCNSRSGKVRLLQSLWQSFKRTPPAGPGKKEGFCKLMGFAMQQHACALNMHKPHAGCAPASGQEQMLRSFVQVVQNTEAHRPCTHMHTSKTRTLATKMEPRRCNARCQLGNRDIWLLKAQPGAPPHAIIDTWYSAASSL